MNEKIQTQHRNRAAYVYVRQSTAHQVRHHHQGRQRQYDLAAHARELDFARVVVIDDDQGKTGSGLVERPGFATLLSAVCGGEAGAVFALEASRLARNNRDWHHLIDLCSLTETLIIDADGIYDPRQLNDRLLLGLKGTMSEFELGLFRQRARTAFEMKIAEGHALWEMPVGLVRDEDDRVEKIADRQVQAAIVGVFAKFRELGSARQATLWYRDEKVLLPEAVPGTRGHEAVWRLPGENRLRQILKNPCYAGALAYGRTETKLTVEEGRARKATSRNRKPREKWKVLILDNHVGYITWEEYLENQAMLESNAAQREPTGKGAAKKGPALLAGLLRCGHCGRKLFVAYSGKRGRAPRYACHGGRENRGSAGCQSLGGTRIDRAVADTVLEAIQPAGVQAALDAMAQFDQLQDEKRKALEMALEKARYEVDRARRQYDAIDPANRLVAGELEERWNTALAHASELERQCAHWEEQRTTLTDEQQARLLELGRILPALWDHSAASADLKKRILRTVLEEIVIRDDEQRRNHLLVLHWKGGVHSELQVPRNTTGKKPNDTAKTALELIEELSKVCSDQTIAAVLNRLGYKTGAGKTWRLHSVYNARYIHRLTNYRKQGAWVTIQQAATELGVSQTVISRLIREQTLPATQLVETTPWIIARESLSLPAVQTEIEAVHAGRQLRRHDTNQQELPLK
jgi:DNA invertase Pin-like site-specific DNA recombinase